MHDYELVIDNFAGGGGASTGMEQAIGRPIDIAINHDPEAIAMHKINHPHTEHLCQSVWAVNPRDVVGNRPVGLVWFSPDCKHFSIAKGAKPVEKNIRDLAWVVPMWGRTVKPRIMMIENVQEFMKWGPLIPISNDNGSFKTDEWGNTLMQPDPKKKGEVFHEWIKEIKKCGYKVEWQFMKGSDYGAPTIRKRLFIVCRCDGEPIVWPEPSHGDETAEEYRTAAQCINWGHSAPSIFTRKRPLAENTMIRIAKGLKKYVFENPKPFLIKCNHSYPQFRGQSLEEPLQTITGKNPYGLITPYLTECANASGKRVMPADEPLRTITAETKGGTHAVVTPIISQQFGQSIGNSVDDPLGAVTQTPKAALVSAFMAKHYGGVVGCRIDQPAPTVTARGTQNQIVTSHMIKMRGNNIGHGTDEPVHTISAGGNHIGEVRAFLLKYYGADEFGQSVETPLHSVTSKERFGLITIHGQDYQIVDIGMRMLQPRELYRAQGFPEDYIIKFKYKGKMITKTSQVRMCGNSVCPPKARALTASNFTIRKIENAHNGSRNIHLHNASHNVGELAL